MLRGFRWQFLAFVISGLLFGVVIIFRFTGQPQPTPPTPVPTSPTPIITETAIPPTETPPITPTLAATPLPDNPNPVPANTVVTYREALVGTLQRLNPLLADLNPVDRDITALIFEGLTRINDYGEPVGALAQRWEMSGDGLEYVFILREDVLWQDGTRFTAADVVFTFHLLSDPAFPGSADVSAFWRTVEVQKLSDALVRFRLTQPLASFPANLTMGILPEHALRGTTAAQLASHPFNISPIGTGAYQLEGIYASDGITIDQVDLRAAPVYRQRPEGQANFAMSRVSFRLYPTFEAAVAALQNNQVDGLAARNRIERQALTGLNTINIQTGIEPKVGILLFNWDEGDDVRFFKDLRVRQALMLGLNRSAPIESRMVNQVVLAESPLLLNSWAYTDVAYPETNPAAAIEMFKMANILSGTAATAEGEATPTPDPTLPRFTFTILTPADPALMGIATEFATQWSFNDPQTGLPLLRVTTESVPADIFQTRLDNAEFQAAIVELPLGADPDVFAYWHVGQYPDGKNYGGSGDDRLSENLERARRETNGINRITLYRQFQQGFIERAIAIPLYYPLYTYAVRANLQGVQLGFLNSPADRFRTLANWRFE
jgi:peptide/nickel transport system substrate-binding protein